MTSLITIFTLLLLVSSSARAEDSKTHLQELLDRAKQRQNQQPTSQATSPSNTESSNLEEVKNKLDALKNSAAEEKPKVNYQVTTTKRPEPVKEEPKTTQVRPQEPVKTQSETKVESKPIKTQSESKVETKTPTKEPVKTKIKEPLKTPSDSKIDTKLGKEQKTIKEEIPLEEKSSLTEKSDEEMPAIEIKKKITSIKDKEPEYLMVIEKTLKSLEEDSWNEVRYNTEESLEYFNREKEVYQDPVIGKYYKITLAFLRFAEGGLELDRGDFANFEQAEASYLDAEDILSDVETNLKSDDTVFVKKLLEIIAKVKAYINEDLDYINQVVGIE